MYDTLSDKFDSFNDNNGHNNHIWLFIAIIFCILIFTFIAVRAYKLSQINKNEEGIEIIRNSGKPIKIVVSDNKITAENTDKDFFALVNDDYIADNQDLKIVVDNVSEHSDLDSKINELFEKNELQNNEKITSKSVETVEIDKNIKQVVLNKSPDKKIEVKNQISKIRVQLGALRDENYAIEYKNNLLKIHNDLFANLTPYIKKVDLKEKGVFYRIQFGDFDSRESAMEFCNKYIKMADNKFSSCIVVEDN